MSQKKQKYSGIFKYKKTIGLSLIVTGTVCYFGLDNSRLYTSAGIRAFRCGYSGLKVFRQYKKYGINEESHQYAAKQLYNCFIKNGGCYIKFGQIIAQLDHLLPEAYITTLEPLCNQNPIEDFEIVKALLEKELKRPLNEIFEYIEEKPVGSASLAQVHKAKLLNGKMVAIKVQHKDVEFNSPGDIAIIRFGCDLTEKLFPEFKYRWLADEIETNLPKEIDFIQETNNIKRIKNLSAKDFKNLIIPHLYEEYITKKVIVMSFEEGKSITDLKYLKDNDIKLTYLSTELAHIFNKQIFEYGFVHADPHSANVFVRKENGEVKIILLDHGLYRELPHDFRINYANFWKGIITQNVELLAKACRNLNVSEENIALYISVVTSKTYTNIMSKDNKYDSSRKITGQINTSQEKDEIRSYAQKYHKQITQVLSSCRPEIRLLIKINEFIRTLDRKMGNPINSYEIMMYYIYNELIKEEKTFWGKASLNSEYLYYKFWFCCYDAYYIITNLFSRGVVENNESGFSGESNRSDSDIDEMKEELDKSRNQMI